VNKRKPYWCGLVEGFYGRPWSWKARREAIGFLNAIKLNTYIYAPKDDPFARLRWRESYPASQLREFRKTITLARTSGVHFVPTVSPGHTMDLRSASDRHCLERKLLSFCEMGATRLGILFDDLPGLWFKDLNKPKYRSLTERQCDTANKIYEKISDRVPNLEMVYCPTRYCGKPQVNYNRWLGRALHPQIHIFWTGPGVFSPAITSAHVRALAEALQRKPMIWDNFPVNDAAPNRVHLGPYMGRSTGIRQHTAGICLNPMIQPRASRVALATFADFLAQGRNYQPWRSWEKSLSHLGRPGRALQGLAACFLRSPILPMPEGTHFPKEALSNGLLRVDPKKTTAALYPEVQRELGPWLRKYTAWQTLLQEAENHPDLSRKMILRIMRLRDGMSPYVNNHAFAQRIEAALTRH